MLIFMCELVHPHGPVQMSLPMRLSADPAVHLRPCADAFPYVFADTFFCMSRVLSVRR